MTQLGLGAVFAKYKWSLCQVPTLSRNCASVCWHEVGDGRLASVLHRLSGTNESIQRIGADLDVMNAPAIDVPEHLPPELNDDCVKLAA